MYKHLINTSIYIIIIITPSWILKLCIYVPLFIPNSVAPFHLCVFNQSYLNQTFDFIYTFVCCCCSVSKSCLILCHLMDCTAHQASLSFTLSWSFLRFMSIESMMPSNHLIFCCSLSSCPQSFPASGSFPMSLLFAWGGQSIGVSASASVFPMNTQNWSLLGWTGWIFLQSKGSQVLSNTTVQKHQFFSAQLSLQSNSHIRTQLLEKP